MRNNRSRPSIADAEAAGQLSLPLQGVSEEKAPFAKANRARRVASPRRFVGKAERRSIRVDSGLRPEPSPPQRQGLSESFLRLPEVKAATGLSRSTIYARVGLGKFPAPVSLGGHSVGWPASRVNAWIQKTMTGNVEPR